MRLYTINATSDRVGMGDKLNAQRRDGFPRYVAEVLSTYGIDGFTIYKVDGYWKGKPEVSFKIEVCGDNVDFNLVGNVAIELRDVYEQDSVMVTLPDNTVEFI